MTIKAHLDRFIKRPLITEKAVLMKEKLGRYLFAVTTDANKGTIRRAVEELFNVKVQDVRTLIVRGKKRRVGRYASRRPNWKKAIVTLKEGQKIEAFETK